MNRFAVTFNKMSPSLVAAWLFTGGVAAALYLLLARTMYHIIATDIATHSFAAQGDFATMWKAGLLIRAGDVLTLYDRHRLDLWMQHRFGGQMADESWLYTPPMGMLAVLVSWVPLPLSFWLWRATMAVAAALMLWRAGLRWWVILAGLAGPVEASDLLLGQNGTLTGGLLAAALLSVESRPRLAGILAGCLCIKPQVGILLPAVLLRWRYRWALVACAGNVMLLAAIATWVEGWRAWVWFVTLAQPNAGRILAIPFGQVFQWSGFTVFLMVRSLGAGLRLAWAVQGAASIIAGISTWLLWGRAATDNTARMAMTVCLSMLAMPYGFSYDLVAFSIAVAALAPGAGPVALPILGLLWFWPFLDALLAAHIGLVLTPLAALTCLALAAARLKTVERSFNSEARTRTAPACPT